MNLLITGGAGFIGSNFLTYITNKYTNYNFVNIDSLTYAGNLDNLKKISGLSNYHFIQGDIRDRKFLENLFEKYQFNGVIHFAAESHVDNSIEDPSVFVETNINGTFTLLEVSRKFWMEYNGDFKKGFEGSRFLHISTDEVYGALGIEGYFKESTPYAPNSPYSASKAAADMLVRSYYHTFGMNVVTTNCSNNYGPMQHEEKLIPKIIRKALAFEQIPIYGSGMNIRDWLYVEDHCRAIELVFHNGIAGETYLVGGNNERTNIEIATVICEILDKKCQAKLSKSKFKSFKELITFVEDRAGHDFRYAIDAEKIRRELGWLPNHSFEEGMDITINYYLK
ncbi:MULTISPECIES: dTDP-glucose 4,6-dehydratase [Lysinibacillus]|uniref:dTDP-glucose 4,6-dehydratase n=1 Tax=Lysinibacillus xylanilyticus TaxID=582475 RepID=A0ABV3VWX2_9BACI